jgi:hypothetical protein
MMVRVYREFKGESADKQYKLSGATTPLGRILRMPAYFTKCPLLS